MSDRLDDEIIAALRGEAERRRWAVSWLYGRYAGRIKCYMTRSGLRDEAEGLMHEVFVRVLRRGDTFSHGAERFEAWLWAIARNVLIDRVAANQCRERHIVEAQIDADELTDPYSNPESDADASDIRECFWRRFEQFKLEHPARATALSWLVVDQLEIEDIAKILGRTHHATCQYLSECRRKLRPFMEPCRKLLRV